MSSRLLTEIYTHGKLEARGAQRRARRKKIYNKRTRRNTTTVLNITETISKKGEIKLNLMGKTSI